MTRIVGLIILVVGIIVAWDFVLNYGLRSNWRSHAYGRITLAFKFTTALLLTVSAINAIFTVYPGKNELRVIIFALFVAAFGIQDIFLHKQLSKDDKEKEYVD